MTNAYRPQKNNKKVCKKISVYCGAIKFQAAVNFKVYSWSNQPEMPKMRLFS